MKNIDPDMITFIVRWFRLGKSTLALVSHWKQQGCTVEEAFAGMRSASEFYAQHKATVEQAHEEALQQHFFNERANGSLDPEEALQKAQAAFYLRRRAEVAKERYLERVRSAPVMRSNHDVIERGPRTGILEVLPEYESRRDRMPSLTEGLRRRTA